MSKITRRLNSLALLFAIACQNESKPTDKSTKPTPTVVFKDEQGRKLQANSLPKDGTKIQWTVEGLDDVPPAAKQLHDQARRIGAAGQYDRALELLAEASKLAPEWPYPWYDAAFTTLLTGDTKGALELFRKTLKLSPRGFFSATTAEHYLSREVQGTLPTGTYQRFLDLEFQNEDKRRTGTRKLTEEVPDFSPAWKDYANLSEGTARDAAIERGLACNPDVETRGFLLINKAFGLDGGGKSKEAKRILDELASDNTGSLGVQQMASKALIILASAPPKSP